MISIPSINSLGNMECTPIATQPCAKKKALSIKENTMNTSTNTFESERRALRDLVFSLVREKNRALRKEYHIDAYKPETVGELKQLLKDGKVTIDPDYDKEDILDNPGFMEYTSLGTVLAINYQKPDKKAFREACTKLEKEQQRLLTQIAVLPPEEGLKRAESFEKTTIH